MKTRRYVTFFSLLFLIALLIGLYFVPPVVSQKSGTERTTEYNSDGELVNVERIHDNDLLVEKKEFDIKTGKLRRRITYKYLKGFKQADTSTTNYQPDGKTPQNTTNVDHDKDGNTTSTVTTNYDETGKETGGSKRETDSKTGKARCYNWIPSKQVYEEVECPKKPWVSSLDTDNAKVETGGGLIKVNFNVEGGRVIVNLPDDMRAGDTISGTVVVEPKGNTPEERTSNLAGLRGYVIEIGGEEQRASRSDTSPGKPPATTSPSYPPIQTIIVLSPEPTEIDRVQDPTKEHVWYVLPDGNGFSGAFTFGIDNDKPYEWPDSLPHVKLKLEKAPPGAKPPVQAPQPGARSSSWPVIASATVPVLEMHVTTPLNNREFNLPTLGQQGRPVEVFGPFDGIFANTTLAFGPAGSTVQDFEKNTENVSGGFGLIKPLAESPRKLTFNSPPTFTGPVQLFVKEGGTTTAGKYRNLGVRLTAPKTTLKRNERIAVTIEVSGLQELQEHVPVQLDSKGVITMEGGNPQNFLIKPADVTPDGRYTTNRTITGVQTGGFTVTATVIVRPFDICLQDDNTFQTRLMWNSFTGDYIFLCQGSDCSRPGGNATGTPQSGGTTITPSNVVIPPLNFAGTGTPTMKGCIITLSHNAPDRRVFATLDVCTKTGDATVQPPAPAPKFTITDRNVSDNTCASPPPR